MARHPKRKGRSAESDRITPLLSAAKARSRRGDSPPTVLDVEPMARAGREQGWESPGSPTSQVTARIAESGDHQSDESGDHYGIRSPTACSRPGHLTMGQATIWSVLAESSDEHHNGLYTGI